MKYLKTFKENSSYINEFHSQPYKVNFKETDSNMDKFKEDIIECAVDFDVTIIGEKLPITIKFNISEDYPLFLNKYELWSINNIQSVIESAFASGSVTKNVSYEQDGKTYSDVKLNYFLSDKEKENKENHPAELSMLEITIDEVK